MIIFHCLILVIGMVIGYGVNYILSKFRNISVSPKIDHCSNFLHFPKYINVSKVINCHVNMSIDLCKIIELYVGQKVYSNCEFSDHCNIENVLGIDRPEDDIECKILTKHHKKN